MHATFSMKNTRWWPAGVSGGGPKNANAEACIKEHSFPLVSEAPRRKGVLYLWFSLSLSSEVLSRHLLVFCEKQLIGKGCMLMSQEKQVFREMHMLSSRAWSRVEDLGQKPCLMNIISPDLLLSVVWQFCAFRAC